MADSGSRDCPDEHALYPVVLALLVLLRLHDRQSYYSLFGFAQPHVETKDIGSWKKYGNLSLYKLTLSQPHLCLWLRLRVTIMIMVTVYCYGYGYGLRNGLVLLFRVYRLCQ